MLFVKDILKADGKDELAGFGFGASLTSFVAAMVNEIALNADEGQRRGFFGAVGRRLAEAHSVKGTTSMIGLTKRCNNVWRELGWGHVELETDDDGIDIFHHGMPQALEGDEQGLWNQIAPYILEGAYDAWFRQIGSSERLSTQILRENEGCIELRHGL